MRQSPGTSPNRMPPMPSLVYIGGYGRSGSTILELHLAERLGAFAAGELSHLFTWSASGLPCSCGEPLPACGLWGPILADVRAQFGSRDFASLSHLVEHDTGAAPTQIVQYNKLWTLVFGSLARRTGCRVIVDSSKTAGGSVRAARLMRLTERERTAWFFLHLIRDPKAVLHSALRGDNWSIEGLETEPASRMPMLRAAVGWNRANAEALRTRRMAPDALSAVVTYEDFARDSTATVSRILSDAASAGIGLGNTKRLPASLDHGIAGNRLRRGRKESAPAVVPDLEWMTRPRSAAQTLGAVLGPMGRVYASERQGAAGLPTKDPIAESESTHGSHGECRPGPKDAETPRADHRQNTDGEGRYRSHREHTAE